MSINTLLFDLDGTLLPLEMETFMRGYFGALVPRIAHLVDKAQIVDQIWAATKDVMENEDPTMNNLEVFKRSFFSRTDVREEDIWPLFDAFYDTTFAGLQHLTNPTDISREICRTAFNKGYRLVLATNPIFPEVATRHRMWWAGIEDIPFELVTTMENSHFCKPNPKYFVEILDRLDISPFEAMMFGNDVQEDGVAGKLGIQTYLVTDHVHDRGVGHVEFTHEGKLADVLEFVKDLPNLR